MKLSDAIVAGQEFASTQLRGGGYYQFDERHSLEKDRIKADTLFSAYLGEYKGAGLLAVVRALQGPDSDAGACKTIQSGLMKAWPALGSEAGERVKSAARAQQVSVPKPGKHPIGGEILSAYICRLNDREELDREAIAGVLRQAGY